MGKGDHLGELEHLVLLAIAAVGDEAHGRAIYEAILEATSRDLAITGVHVTLRRLEKKGLVTSAFHTDEQSSDARPRKIYRATPGAEALLWATRQGLDRLWRAAEQRGRS